MDYQLDPTDSYVSDMLKILKDQPDSQEDSMIDKKFLNPMILHSSTSNGISTVSQFGSSTVNYCIPWDVLTDQMRLNRVINYINMRKSEFDMDETSLQKLKKVILSSFNNLNVQYDQSNGIIDNISNLTLSCEDGKFSVGIKRMVSKVTRITKLTGIRRSKVQPAVDELLTPTNLEFNITL